jgi:colanic acid/amylovoran biosynthesis glycosyltransferase
MAHEPYATGSPGPGSIAYLVSEYPAVSHTFIAREIDAVRARGVTVRTMSIRRTPETQLLTDADRRAAADTFSVLPLQRGRFLRAHLRAFARRPREYLATLGVALGLSPGGVRDTLWQLFYFAEAILIWDECERTDTRHIHAHFANVASAVALLAARFGRADGMTWSFTMHGPTEFDDVTRFALAAKVRRAAFVACISDFCRSQLLKLVDPEHWDKLEIVHCGLDRDHAAAAADGAHHNGRHGALRILCVGRLVPEKGQLILLQALAELGRRGLETETVFVGDGPARAQLEAASRRLGVSGQVSFAGSLGADRVSDLYRDADVFCLPSFSEGVPVVLMEAMAHELPVVTTRVAGIAELVEDNVSGLVVPAGREEAVADAIQRLASDPDLRRRWGQAGRERVLSDYDVARSAEQLEELFRRRGARSGTPAARQR